MTVSPFQVFSTDKNKFFKQDKKLDARPIGNQGRMAM